MNRVLKGVLAIILCVMVMVPSAWGLSRFSYSAHANGGYRSPQMASAPNTGRIFFFSWPILGLGQRSILIVRVTSSAQGQPAQYDALPAASKEDRL